MMKIIGELKAENAQLKAEVERLTDAITRGASVPDAYPVSDDQP
jgi:cell division protein FtsB